MIYFELFLGFLKIGCFAFGGAYGAIPLIWDVVVSYGWLSEDMLTYMIAVSDYCNLSSGFSLFSGDSAGNSAAENRFEESVCSGGSARLEALRYRHCSCNRHGYARGKLFWPNLSNQTESTGNRDYGAFGGFDVSSQTFCKEKNVPCSFDCPCCHPWHCRVRNIAG